jgi:hypothetical protein
VPVLGSGEELKFVIDSQPISALILSSSRLGRYREYRTISLCQERGIPVLRGALQLMPVSTDGISFPQARSPRQYSRRSARHT